MQGRFALCTLALAAFAALHLLYTLFNLEQFVLLVKAEGLSPDGICALAQRVLAARNPKMYKAQRLNTQNKDVRMASSNMAFCAMHRQ